MSKTAGLIKVLLGNIEFGEYSADGQTIEMALVQRPYRMLSLDEDIAETVGKSLVAAGKYRDYVIPDFFEGEVAITWKKEDEAEDTA